MTIYSNFREVSDLQITIMRFVDIWARRITYPIPRKTIIDEMEDQGITKYATISAMNGLVKMKYLRKAITGPSIPNNRTSFVQLRRV